MTTIPSPVEETLAGVQGWEAEGHCLGSRVWCLGAISRMQIWLPDILGVTLGQFTYPL